MDRIGIFGGSFNPVTCGHLWIALAALETLALDRLIFIPAAQSPFKPDQVPAPAAERLRLLRLALAGWTRAVVDDQEIRRGGISWTIDTVRACRREHPGARLFCVIGADHLPGLPQWRAAAELAQLTEFAVCPRPGQPAAVPPPPFRGQLLDAAPMGVSASLVRARAAAGLPLDGLVPPAVAEAILNSQLYRSTSNPPTVSH